MNEWMTEWMNVRLGFYFCMATQTCLPPLSSLRSSLSSIMFQWPRRMCTCRLPAKYERTIIRPRVKKPRLKSWPDRSSQRSSIINLSSSRNFLNVYGRIWGWFNSKINALLLWKPNKIRKCDKIHCRLTNLTQICSANSQLYLTTLKHIICFYPHALDFIATTLLKPR